MAERPAVPEACATTSERTQLRLALLSVVRAVRNQQSSFALTVPLADNLEINVRLRKRGASAKEDYARRVEEAMPWQYFL